MDRFNGNNFHFLISFASLSVTLWALWVFEVTFVFHFPYLNVSIKTNFNTRIVTVDKWIFFLLFAFDFIDLYLVASFLWAHSPYFLFLLLKKTFLFLETLDFFIKIFLIKLKPLSFDFHFHLQFSNFEIFLFRLFLLGIMFFLADFLVSFSFRLFLTLSKKFNILFTFLSSKYDQFYLILINLFGSSS